MIIGKLIWISSNVFNLQKLTIESVCLQMKRIHHEVHMNTPKRLYNKVIKKVCSIYGKFLKNKLSFEDKIFVACIILIAC